MPLVPTPTDHGLTPCLGYFPTLTQALDYAAEGRSGMNFHAPRGELSEVLPYAELAVESRSCGARLLATGLVPGDRVGLIAETHGDFVRVFMGCLYAGLVPCPMPLPTAFGARDAYGGQVRRIVDVADARAVIVPADYVDWVAPPLQDRALCFIGPLQALPDTAEILVTSPPDVDALAYLQFSSGTTEAPKGIAVSHRAVMANVSAMADQALNMTELDRGVSWLPFYHDMGLVGCVLLPIATQTSIDYLATRDFIRRPGLWPTMISRAQATMSYAPSFGYELAARRGRNADGLRLEQWRIAGIGGDMIKTLNLAEFSNAYVDHGFRAESFLPSYGMAELTLGLSFTNVGLGCRSVRLDSAALEQGRVMRVGNDAANARDFAVCGRALHGHEIEIRAQDGSVLPSSTVGTVFARGPSVMKGYFGEPDATRAVLDGNGWLDTGDLGFLDENDELILTGRAKDLIIINGRNIWPQDIEWTVERQVDGVREGGVVAVGISTPSDERLTILVECRPLEPKNREAMLDRTDALVREVYQVAPDVVLIRPGALPRTSSGKLSRAKARELYLSGAFEP